MNKLMLTLVSFYLFTACGRNKTESDASGTFEATEIIVSAQMTGQIEEFNVIEGNELNREQCLGYIDTTQLYLQKLQLQTSSQAINSRRPDISTQISSLKDQINNAKKDKARIGNMFRDGAATQKQMDDVNTNLRVLESQLAAQLSTLSISTNSLDKESSTYQIQVEQIEDKIQKSYIINPIQGIVLNKYAEAKEYVVTGKALYKIADIKHLYLRAYIVSNQLTKVKIGQKVTVSINNGEDAQKTYEGTVSWIANKAEFTPKTIQTKDERQNLVYALKVAVDNSDGIIKIGMYGDVIF